jgi:hypothetical protein
VAKTVVVKVDGKPCLADLRSIILSGYADPTFEDEAMATGAFAYLRKFCPLSGSERVLEQTLGEQAAVESESDCVVFCSQNRWSAGAPPFLTRQFRGR